MRPLDRFGRFGIARWRLSELLLLSARQYVALGSMLDRMATMLDLRAVDLSPLSADDTRAIVSQLNDVRARCQEISLALSQSSVTHWINEFSQGRCLTSGKAAGAVSEIKRIIEAEIDQLVFWYIPHARCNAMTEMYEKVADYLVHRPWPTATANLNHGAQCFGSDLMTACVFHSMRAVENALTVTAKSLGNIDTQRGNWQNIIEQIEANIKGLDKLAKGDSRTAMQEFYSGIAMQFRYIKNAWRNHVMHGRATYSESEAKDIWWHSYRIVEACSEWLVEPL